MPKLLALTLWPEWAFAVAHLGKRIENRSWRPPKRHVGSRIAIHAGAHIGGRPGRPARIAGLNAVESTAANSDLEVVFFVPIPQVYVGDLGTFPISADLYPNPTRPIPLATRAIVAVATIGEVVETAEAGGPWFAGPLGWRLDDLVTLSEPVACPRGDRGSGRSTRVPNEPSRTRPSELPSSRQVDVALGV